LACEKKVLSKPSLAAEGEPGTAAAPSTFLTPSLSTTASSTIAAMPTIDDSHTLCQQKYSGPTGLYNYYYY
jgi:hypothetical protein